MPSERTQFSWSENKQVPEGPGCYVIATMDDTVLYVGQATRSVRARMAAHLESAEKRKGINGIVPFWFYYLAADPQSVGAIEGGWINQSILEDGMIPPLNRVHSPV